MPDVAVLNAGGWGTAMACVLAANGHGVRLWARRPESAARLARRRENDVYLPGVSLPAGVMPTADLREAVAGVRYVVVAAITRGLRDLGQQLAPLLGPEAVLLVLTKGLEAETWRRPSEVLLEALAPERPPPIAALSGPTHAEEVARGLPTAAVVACEQLAVAEELQALVRAPHLRLYTSPDIVGVELCAAAKNVIALAAGIGDGLGSGDNGKAALLTRSLAELGRFVRAYGGDAATVAGLAGVGDLVGTCTSRHSRNRWAGEQIGQGKSLGEVLASTPMVVEGVPATRGVIALARARQIELPICEAVYRVLYEGQPPAAAMHDLLARPPRPEAPPAPTTTP